MAISEEQLKKIEEFVKDKLKDGDYNHDIRHTVRAVKLAKFIAEKEKADVDVCIVSAWLHDIAQPTSGKKHNEVGVEMAEPFLKEIEFDQEFIEKVKHCIYCHNSSTIGEAKTIEAKVVYDSDKLQLIGPFGFCRVLSDELVFQKLNLMEGISETRKIQLSKYDKLQTKTAKELIKKPHELMLEFNRMFDILEKSDELEKI